MRKMTRSHRLKVLAPRVIPMKIIAIMKRRQMTNIIYRQQNGFKRYGKKVYKVTAKTRTKLLKKLKDGRQWKKDSRTT